MISIYGDSFAAPNYNVDPNLTSWYDQLAQHEDVSNYAIMGSGPQFSYSLYLKHLETSDKVVFIHSVKHRLNWFGVDPKQQVNISYVDGKVELHGDKRLHAVLGRDKPIKAFYELYKDDIFFHYHMLDYSGIMQNSFFEKGIVLKHVAETRKVKTIYFCLYYHYFKNYDKFDIQISEYFYCPRVGLQDESRKEKSDDDNFKFNSNFTEFLTTDKEDIRQNHRYQGGHDWMYNMIREFFYDDAHIR